MGGRLRQALDARDMEPPDLIRRTELSKGTIYNVLNDTTKPDKIWADTAAKICDVLRINRDWLLYGRGPMDGLARPAPASDEWSDILGYAQAVGLGDGAEAQEYAETHNLKFRAESLARKRLNARHLAVMYGKGDSMLPRIRAGDAILFDTSDVRPRDEALFVIQTHGIEGNAYSVKRCRDFGDTIYFDALNPEGDHNWRKPRRMDDRRHPITIIGRVRWIGSWED